MTKDAKNNGYHKSKTGTQDSDPFFSEMNKHMILKLGLQVTA